MNLSGSIGYSFLSKNDKKILVFADAHSEVEYCKEDYIKISNLFKSLLKKDKYQILLEEVDRRNVELNELWPKSEHIQNLKKLYLENKEYIIPIDIRPFLYKFSWEFILEDKFKEYGKVKLIDYLENLDIFFKLKSDNLVFNNEIKKLISNNDYIENINKNFNNLKFLYLKFKYMNKNILNKNLIDIYNLNKDIFKILDDLLSSIMEWYTIVLILSTKKISIIHLGLFHSREIVYNLIKNYKFDLIEENGITKYPKNNLKSCVILSKKMLKNLN